MKQNLASVRIVSFLSIAWLCAQAVRLGWIRVLAERLSGVVTVGRQGLVCFVGGAVLSISADVGLHVAELNTRNWHTFWPMQLIADVLVIAILLLLGNVANRFKRARTLRAVQRSSKSFAVDRQSSMNEYSGDKGIAPPA
jgi:hypothetical protein